MQYAFRFSELESRHFDLCDEPEKQRRIGVAVRCLEQGFSIARASYITGVPVETIEEKLNVPNNFS